MRRAIDVSNYSGQINGATISCWRNQGYDHLICGTQRREITRQQLQTAQAEITLDAYVYLYWSRDIAAQVREALETISGLNVGRLWLDCEDDAGGRTPEQVVSLIRDAVAACDNFPNGIYTGRWWWQPSTGDSQEFAGLPLWHAEYTAHPNVLPDFDGFRPYGGWTRPSMWQFQGTTNLCGVTVDLNLMDAEAPVQPLNPDERWELDVLRAGRRFEQALHNGRFALRPAASDPHAVELIKVEDGRWLPFEPACLLQVD